MRRRAVHEERVDLGTWETRIQRIVRTEVARVLPHIPEDAVIVDVGANVGLFTAAILESRPKVRAYLFEPVAEYAERARTRFAKNQNVSVLRIALSDSNGRTTIYKPRHNPGGNSIVKVQVDKYTRENAVVWDSEDVEVRVFDDWAKEHGVDRVDFLKTDTEGNDYAVLKGVLPFLDRTGSHPVILAELLSKTLHHAWDEQQAVVEHLYGLGYGRVDMENMREIEDLLFVPRPKTKAARDSGAT
ncbi:MAG: FkbM family methyltransferase [Planctomycetes bacterium]|nr:FkbM family methyltransferase [Planctomycetota bacterium]